MKQKFGYLKSKDDEKVDKYFKPINSPKVLEKYQCVLPLTPEGTQYMLELSLANNYEALNIQAFDILSPNRKHLHYVKGVSLKQLLDSNEYCLKTIAQKIRITNGTLTFYSKLKVP